MKLPVYLIKLGTLKQQNDTREILLIRDQSMTSDIYRQSNEYSSSQNVVKTNAHV